MKAPTFRRPCRCCGHPRRGELEREAAAAAADPDSDAAAARLWALAGRYGVSLEALRRHLERHELVAAAVVATANREALRAVIESAGDPRDVALAMLEAISAYPEPMAVVIAELAASPPWSVASQRVDDPAVARASGAACTIAVASSIARRISIHRLGIYRENKRDNQTAHRQRSTPLVMYRMTLR